jgi:hypothetical protein
MSSMTAKQTLLERAAGFSEEQATAALEAAEQAERDASSIARLRARGVSDVEASALLAEARATLTAVGDAFAADDPAELEREALAAVREARAERVTERRA